MNNAGNRAVILRSRPDGEVKTSDFEFVEWPAPELSDDQILVETQFLSVDPYMRGRLNDAKSYVPPFQLGEPLQGDGVARVIESSNAKFEPGDTVCGFMSWVKNQALVPKVRKIDPDEAPVSYHLGLLGMPGRTAWVGMQHIGNPKSGETVFVSAASGAVGSVVGQIAKNLGCRAVGCAGTDEKVAYLTAELGFDAAFNYRAVDDIGKAIEEACPDGIDINFENVGGDIMDAVFRRMNNFGRFILCGMISDYDPPRLSPGPPLLVALSKRLRIEGFIVSDYPDLCKEWDKVGPEWLSEGKLKYHETVADGLESLPQALIDVLKGHNFGKQVVKIS